MRPRNARARHAWLKISNDPPACTSDEAPNATAAPSNPNRGTSSQLAIPELAATAANNGAWAVNARALVIM